MFAGEYGFFMIYIYRLFAITFSSFSFPPGKAAVVMLSFDTIFEFNRVLAWMKITGGVLEI